MDFGFLDVSMTLPRVDYSFDGRTSISVCVNCTEYAVSWYFQHKQERIADHEAHLKKLSEANRQGVGRHDECVVRYSPPNSALAGD